MISWCDIVLSSNFKIPNNNENYIGVSKEFECRWSFTEDNIIVKEASKENGIAGIFVFKNKKELINIPDEGEFVYWLKSKNQIKFSRLDLYGAREIGTMLAYEKNSEDKPKCRPFNHIEFLEKEIIKTPITKQGEDVAVKEKNWYKVVQKYNYDKIPKISSFTPLTMEKIDGKNIFEYNNFTYKQKEMILKSIINMLDHLHVLDKPIKANSDDCFDNYVYKTFDRLNTIKDLMPFANNEFIRINGNFYRNIFFMEGFLEEQIRQHLPKFFI